MIRRFRNRVRRYVHFTADLIRSAIADIVRPFLWRPISTAPFNRDLKLRTADTDGVLTLPFPCRRTNGGHWINADLGTAVLVNPTQWCVWRRSQPLRSSAAAYALKSAPKAQRYREPAPVADPLPAFSSAADPGVKLIALYLSIVDSCDFLKGSYAPLQQSRPQPVRRSGKLGALIGAMLRTRPGGLPVTSVR